jgi:hypothetical protein
MFSRADPVSALPERSGCLLERVFPAASTVPKRHVSNPRLPKEAIAQMDAPSMFMANAQKAALLICMGAASMTTFRRYSALSADSSARSWRAGEDG